MIVHLVAMSAMHLDFGAASGAANTILGGANSACAGSCGTKNLSDVFKKVANTLTYIIGVGSVLMVLYGGFRYTISRGDASNVKQAKDTILYAVTGVVVSIVAYAIINFVVKAV